MPRYYFDMRDANGTLRRDEEGLAFSDLEVAKREAAKTLGEITSEDGVLGLSFEIRDETNRLICVVRTSSDQC
jgi:hypothetical protein